MRINIYGEELTNRVEIVHSVADGQLFTGLRLYLYLPVTTSTEDGPSQIAGPFIHKPGDDDSSAVTLWADDPAKLAAVMERMVSTIRTEIDRHAIGKD